MTYNDYIEKCELSVIPDAHLRGEYPLSETPLDFWTKKRELPSWIRKDEFLWVQGELREIARVNAENELRAKMSENDCPNYYSDVQDIAGRIERAVA